jgi:hypothetical protein
MPKKIEKTAHVEFHERNRSQYDWDTYFKLEFKRNAKGELVKAQVAGEGTEGDQWRFVKGEDFTTSVESFRNTACTAARSEKYGLKCRTMVEYQLDKDGNRVTEKVKETQVDESGVESEVEVEKPIAIALVLQAYKPAAGEPATQAA